MHGHASDASIAAAVVLLALLGIVAAALAAGLAGRGRGWLIVAGAVGGVLFQVGHLGEHVAQAGYWTAHRAEAPWMTPWADALADSFARLAPGTAGFGMEAMHLVGNAIFLTAAATILVIVARDGPAQSRAPAAAAVVLQSFHVLEHIALTASVVVGGRPRGVSTLFGALQPGPGLWAYRVWWHLTINVIASALLAVALVRRRRATLRSAQPAGSLPAVAA